MFRKKTYLKNIKCARVLKKKKKILVSVLILLRTHEPQRLWLLFFTFFIFFHLILTTIRTAITRLSLMCKCAISHKRMCVNSFKICVQNYWKCATVLIM